jgi:hypothetical protein
LPIGHLQNHPGSARTSLGPKVDIRTGLCA